MKVASIKLKNFKRFSDLLIRDIPQTAKLVIVVGPNGCGKSSLFDAFLHWYRQRAGFGIHTDQLYYQKDFLEALNWQQMVEVTLHAGAQVKKGSLYVRTAYRNDPDFSVDGINRPNNPSESIRVNRVIDNDQTVSDNYRRLIYDTMAGVYNEANDTKTVRLLREEPKKKYTKKYFEVLWETAPFCKGGCGKRFLAFSPWFDIDRKNVLCFVSVTPSTTILSGHKCHTLSVYDGYDQSG